MEFIWSNNKQTFKEQINPGDSIYIQPFTKHAFAKSGDQNSRFFTIRVSGVVNISAQKELSYFADAEPYSRLFRKRRIDLLVMFEGEALCLGSCLFRLIKNDQAQLIKKVFTVPTNQQNTVATFFER